MPATSALWLVSDTIPVAAAYLLTEESMKQAFPRGAAALYLAIAVWFLGSNIQVDFDLSAIPVEVNFAP